MEGLRALVGQTVLVYIIYGHATITKKGVVAEVEGTLLHLKEVVNKSGGGNQQEKDCWVNTVSRDFKEMELA